LIPSFSDAVLDSISHTVGDALIGRIISNIFSACGITDQSGESTKWKRLYYTFQAVQKEDHCGNRVGAFIESAMSPARWTSDELRDRYSHTREDMNRALLMTGLELGPDGKLRTVRIAASLDEAHERANRLRAVLEKRGVHREVIASCARLLLKDDNYFHTVFEVTKSVANRLRSMSGLDLDDNRLVDEVLECGSRPFPLVALNRYDTESFRNEQKGIAHLARGLFHAFRNVTAHEPAVTWRISEEDSLDMMSTASLIHRRLDSAVITTDFQPRRG